MKTRIYLSHPYGGFRENRERAAALAKMYREIWDAEGKTDWELVNPLEYFAPLAEDGVDDETILMLAVALMQDCDGVLFAPGWKRSRGCRYEHFRLRHSHTDNKYFKAEIPAEVEEAAAHWFGKHHITVRRVAA
jgi:hypothetical protein